MKKEIKQVEPSVNEDIHVLTHDSKVIFEGGYNECLFFLQRCQGHSYDWATRYEGYKISIKEEIV